MIQLAYVEDEPATAECIRKCLDRYSHEKNVSFHAVHFPRAEELLQDYTPHYDLIFLDIRLKGGMSGMDAAAALRKKDEFVQIIFITSLAAYAVKSYEVNALDFILKPFSYDQFAMKMDKAVRVISMNVDVRLSISSPGGMKILSVRDVSFLEVSDHQLIYHTPGGNYSTRETLSALEKTLAGKGFIRISVCYLVNLRFVSGIDDGMLILATGERLTISRSKKKEVFSALARYLGGNY